MNRVLYGSPDFLMRIRTFLSGTTKISPTSCPTVMQFVASLPGLISSV